MKRDKTTRRLLYKKYYVTPSGQKLVEKMALPETESLWYMAQSPGHRRLLKHPVITSFLWMKWQRIRNDWPEKKLRLEPRERKIEKKHYVSNGSAHRWNVASHQQ
jgi:hypothetical protein